MRKRKRGKARFSKVLVAMVITLNVIFAAAVFICFWHTGTEPSALVAAWFTFTTGELWTMGKIKREERKKEEEDI